MDTDGTSDVDEVQMDHSSRLNSAAALCTTYLCNSSGDDEMWGIGRV
jgi:hypothetical protein